MNKQKLEKGFSVWDIDSLESIGARTIDLNSGGIFYIIEPMYVKDPIPAYFKILGGETIETRAGVFKTIKVGFGISNPFLGKLLSPFAGILLFWIEDSPRGLIVKMQFGHDINILDEVSQWKD